jgi:uncharacterized protein (TIGR00251 family)
MGNAAPWRLQVLLQPRAPRDRIIGRHGAAIRVQVQAPPVAGAANAALVELLAETFGVPRRDVRVVHGARGRNKLVEVRTADPASCRRRLDAVLAAGVDKSALRG